MVSFDGPAQISVTEGGPEVEVCVSISQLPSPGEVVIATFETLASSALGEYINCACVYNSLRYLNCSYFQVVVVM